MIEPQNIKLRKKLTEINSNNNADEQIKRINEISTIYNHTIKLVQKFSKQSPDLTEIDEKLCWNCYSCCFDINFGDVKNYVVVPKDYNDDSQSPNITSKTYNCFDQNKSINSEFVNYLIKNYLIEINKLKSKKEYYIIYFENTKPKQAGKYFEGKVTSRWSYLGQLWEHGIWEIPDIYGSKYKFFKKMPREKILSFYIKWIKDKNS